MRCHAVQVDTVDAYDAGFEVAEGLAFLDPEAILLFASADYADFQDLCEGIRDRLENSDTIIFGGSGDGCYATQGVLHRGVSALGINGQGRIRYGYSLHTQAGDKTYRAARTCMREAIERTGGEARLAFVLGDGLTTDGVEVIAGAGSVTDAVLVGGTTGDDRKFKQGWVIAGDRGYSDAVGVLALSGEFDFRVHGAGGWVPIGDVGVVEEIDGNIVKRIGGMPAAEFIRRQLGSPPVRIELALFPLAEYDAQGRFLLRTPLAYNWSNGELTLGGRLHLGSAVRVCHAGSDEILSGVDQAVAGLGPLDFTPAGAVVFSCTARKWILGPRSVEEVQRIFSALGGPLPLAGLPCLGEIAPFRQPDGAYSRAQFHNEHYVILLLGY